MRFPPTSDANGRPVLRPRPFFVRGWISDRRTELRGGPRDPLGSFGLVLSILDDGRIRESFRITGDASWSEELGAYRYGISVRDRNGNLVSRDVSLVPVLKDGPSRTDTGREDLVSREGTER